MAVSIIVLGQGIHRSVHKDKVQGLNSSIPFFKALMTYLYILPFLICRSIGQGSNTALSKM